jgi:hypothetical protein
MILRIHNPRVCGPHSLHLSFNDGTTKRVNVRPLLEGQILEPLRDSTYFARVTLDPVCGTVVWPLPALAENSLFANSKSEFAGRPPNTSATIHNS